MAVSTGVKKALTSAGGKLPADDEKTFTKIVGAIQKSWKIERPQDVMLLNRMVSTWMKMKRVESMLEGLDLYYEQYDGDGRVEGIKVNGLVSYLHTLEMDFRGYYNILSKRDADKGEEKETDFLRMIEEITEDEG